MYTKITLAVFSAVLTATILNAQPAEKKELDHEDFDIWKEIDDQQISNNGRWVTYELEPGKGDPELHLYDAETERNLAFPRAENARISADSRFLVFVIKPPMDTVNAMRRRKVEKKDLPADTLAVYNLESGELRKIPDLKSYKLPEKWSGLLAFTTEPDSLRNGKNNKGYPLTLLSLASGEAQQMPGVTEFMLAEEGAALLLSSDGTDSTLLQGVYRYDFETTTLQPLFRRKATYEQLAMDKEGDQVAFLADTDTTDARIRPFAVYFWREGRDSAVLATDNSAGFLPDDWRISEHGNLHFSEDGAKLYFGIAPPPVLPDTTQLDEEIVNVEVWSYTDKRLYTQQEVMLESEKKRTYTTVWHINENKIIPLADAEVPEVELGNEGKADVALGFNEQPYLQLISWEGYPVCKDVYLIDAKSGKRKMIAEALCGNPHFSPEAKFVYWYSTPDTAWFAYSVAEDKTRQLTNNRMVPFYDELNDRPMHPSSYGIAGWTTEDDFIMIYDRYDIWLIDPQGDIPPNNMTNGRADRRRYRYVRLDEEERAIEEVDNLLFHFFDEESKREGYRWFNIHTGFDDPGLEGDHSYSRSVLKADQANAYVFTREDFQTFPDLLYSDNQLRSFERVSEANPQQSEYRWGTAEPYHWTSLDGEKLEGILIKPEGFDPENQYPAIVYFYERYSDRLNNHWAPEPHRSIINFTFYASRGYVIFIPDIPYKEGFPGKSAYNAVMPGITSLIEEGFIDRERIGVQGHSWGGYQSAYLITQTDLFRCAESGAPVVNMVSAYGGIRWGSGLSRMFQYERTQSRIGGTLWEKPIRYIENSPIFFADQIKTPVLILHNDKDGAVPWYQGIEFFVALRRLGKPAWLLNYNDEPHWPLKYQNRKDFQRRMQQFFDYYLQDAPKPQWMEEGVSPIEKGIDQGYEPAEVMDRG